MALIPCPNCGLQVDAEASGCPDCGANPQTGLVPGWSIACPNCGLQVDSEAPDCQHCGADPRTGVVPESAKKTLSATAPAAVIPPPPPAARTKKGLLSQYRADPEGAATQAYHPAGYVWTFDRKLDGERCYRWRADTNDAFEQGLPVDEADRHGMFAHEMQTAAAPETGWPRHCRFCEVPQLPSQCSTKDVGTIFSSGRSWMPSDRRSEASSCRDRGRASRPRPRAVRQLTPPTGPPPALAAGACRGPFPRFSAHGDL